MLSATQKRELAPFLQETDERYAGVEDFKGLEKKYLTLEAKHDCALQEIAELKSAPAFVSQDTRERGNTKPELSLSRLTRAFINHKIDRFLPSEKVYAKEVEYLQKAFASGTTTAGGFLIPEDWSETIISELGAKAVVLQAGPTIVPVPGKKLHLGAFGADATIAWLGENAGMTESTPATAEVALALNTAKLLSAFSIEWLDYSSPLIDAAFQANLVRSMRRFVDAALLSGSGSNRPTGLRSISSGTTTIGAQASNANGGNLSYDDLVLLLDALDAADVGEEGRAWFMNPRSWTRIRQLKDSTGRPLVHEYDLPLLNKEQLQLFGYPVYRSTKIPKNETKGTGTNLSAILCTDMQDVYVGVGVGQAGIRIDVSEHAGFTNGQIMVRLMFGVDIQPGHAASVGIIDGVA